MPASPSSPIIRQLRDLLNARGEEVQMWLEAKQREHPAPLYTSVDLRHAGFKLAPVDTNLFPAGFNNLSAAARHRAAVEFRHYFAALPKPPKRLLVIPENHTRNLHYLENLHVLVLLLEHTGLEVKIGSLAALDTPFKLLSLSGAEIIEWPLTRDGDALKTSDGFIPDAIVLNNDLTRGPEPLLAGLTQPVLPPAHLGWHHRRKSEHFARYCVLATEFGSVFGLDPWLICPHGQRIGVVNFEARGGQDKLVRTVDAVLAKIRDSYMRHGVTEEPYVFVKADSGTYGMGIMTVKSGAELSELNKKTRNKMSVIKEGTPNTEVIIQEGIPTMDRVNGMPAEPMMYLVGGQPVGGAYRHHPERDAASSLNAPGMTFSGMCDEMENIEGGRVAVAGCDFGAFGLVAQIAALAAARENYTDFDFTI